MMAATTNNLKLIFGGGGFSSSYGFTQEKVIEVLGYLKKQRITSLDTGQVYGESETMIGEAKASSLGFDIDTKVAGGLSPHVHHTKDIVIKAGEDSLKALGVDQV